MVKIGTPEGPFLIRKNAYGEFSVVEFSCMSNTVDGARQRFFQGIMPFFDYLSYVTNSPVYISPIEIDAPNYNQVLEYTEPHLQSVVNTHAGQFVAEMGQSMQCIMRRRSAILAGIAEHRASGPQNRQTAAVELAAGLDGAPPGSLTLAAISAVFTIGYVADMLGEDEDWLFVTVRQRPSCRL